MAHDGKFANIKLTTSLDSSWFISSFLLIKKIWLCVWMQYIVSFSSFKNNNNKN